MIQIPNIVRSYLSKYRSDFHPIVTTLTTSAIAVPLISAIDASLTCPLTRMSTLQMTTGEKTSLKNIYNNHIKGNVVASLYRGFTPLYIQTALLWGNFFVIDDLMKYLLQKRFNQVSYSGLAVASVIGGGIQTCINVIPDTVRVHMQKTATDNLGMHATAKKLIRLHGMRSLFSAVPHKLIGGVVGYSYKSLLRHFWSSQNDKK